MTTAVPRAPRARRPRRIAAIVAAGLACLVAAIAVPAGADSKTQLQGEGESWPFPMLEQLQNSSAKVIAPLEPGYLDLGDEQAREDLASGISDYASIGEPFTADELATAKTNGRSIAYIPYAYGGVQIAFSADLGGNAGGRVASMKLTAPTLANVFAHQITQWGTPEIVSENGPDPTGGGLTNTKAPLILTVTRLDSSWSTAALISYFLADPAAKTIWNTYATSLSSPPDTPLDRWPAETVNSNLGIISGSKGVIDTMMGLDPGTGQRVPGSTTNHIAYLAPAWTTKYNAPLVAIQNKGGAFVNATQAAVQKAVDQSATIDPKTNLVTFDYSKITDATAYPIPMVEYLAVPTKGLSAEKAKALSNFVKYILSDAGQKVVADTDYVPVSQAQRTAGLKIAAALAVSAHAQGGTTTTTTKKSHATTTTTSDVTGTTTDTTPTSGASVDPGPVGGDGGSGGSGLPFTGGGPPAPVVVGAVVILFAAAVGRRHARRARA